MVETNWLKKYDDAINKLASANIKLEIANLQNKALYEALNDLFAQDSGQYDKKSCGHKFVCICPGDKANKALKDYEASKGG